MIRKKRDFKLCRRTSTPYSRYHMPYLYNKLNKSWFHDPTFGLYLGHFWAREPKLHIIAVKRHCTDWYEIGYSCRCSRKLGGGPIFKVVLECSKRCSEPFLFYIYDIQCDFMPKSSWKHSNFKIANFAM